ncbi:uncharacterized protein [Nicotiana sylvestris]|uniref:uncharacterized protein n=1 Tax=Nicotiana sylvestris TaxID=4096 RepID=UPI00388C6EA6
MAQLQSQNMTPSIAEPENTRRAEPAQKRSNENDLETDPAIMRMLEELTKRIEFGEKKIEENDKMVEIYNSRVDQIPGAPSVLKGLDVKKFIQKPFPASAAPMPIPKKFCMPDIPKYNGTTDPNEHITSYTCGIKANDLNDNEIESVLLKKFGETLSKGAMIWYHNLAPNSIDSFAMLADALVKAHVGSIKIRSQAQRDTDRESRFNKEQYQPYVDRRNNGPGRNAPQNDQRNDRGQNSRGLMSKSRYDKHTDPAEAPRLLEFNFSIDAPGIVSTIGRIKDTKWAIPIQTDPSQINPNLMCKYHGTHGHRIEDCRKLREKVAWLFNDGHLREFLSDQDKNYFWDRDARKNEQKEPQHIIHMIIDGVHVPQRPVFKRTKVLITREKQTRSYVPEDVLSFRDEEAEGISQPHNDVLVIFIL